MGDTEFDEGYMQGQEDFARLFIKAVDSMMNHDLIIEGHYLIDKKQYDLFKMSMKIEPVGLVTLGEAMNIKDLEIGSGNVNLTAKVKFLGEVREVNKYGRKLTVVTAVLEDPTGEVAISLWNEQSKDVKVGSKVKVENGYVNDYQGKPQLTLGKFGKISVS